MCLLVVAHRAVDPYALVLAANRDEQHARPSAPADWWADLPWVLGGRDLAAGGSWLALSRHGRLAAVTNVAEPGAAPARRSRGLIVRDFLAAANPFEARAAIEHDGAAYGPFNALLLADGELGFVSNRGVAAVLQPGIHSLSNAPLGADWPKLHRADRGMAAALGAADPISALLDLLNERDDDVSGPDHYRRSLFIVSSAYGTRASTVVLVHRGGRVEFCERRFGAHGRPVGESRYEFRLDAVSTAGS